MSVALDTTTDEHRKAAFDAEYEKAASTPSEVMADLCDKTCNVETDTPP